MDQVVAKQAAEKSLITDGLIPGTQKYNDALQQRIDPELQSQEATGQADTAKQVADANQTAAAQEAITRRMTARRNRSRTRRTPARHITS